MTAAVTGASRGIGRAIARALLSKGARVLVNGYDADKTDATVESLRQQYPGSDAKPQITSAVLSMISQVDGEAAVEVATIGREGMAGLPVFLGVSASPNTIFAQIPGAALRMRAEQLRDVLAGDGALHRQLHRYIQATMVQLSQNVACNRLHSPEERAARWLLMTADRVGAERFPLTQEFLAQMLGVRRATVSITAALLHNAGLISYTRGVITVDDRAGLEDAACDCYGIVRDEFQELAKPA